jgi:two-component system, OmpR family, phosphate regulon sensor histidine kinase PhoR
MKKLRGSAILMVIAILGITGFQLYWLKNNYEREKQNLDIKTTAAFRQTILQLQAHKLKLEKVDLRFDSAITSDVFVPNRRGSRKKFTRPAPPKTPKEPVITMINLIQEKLKDSILANLPGGKGLMITVKGDSAYRGFVDSLKGLKGKLRSVSITRNLDSLMPNAGVISEMHIEKAMEKAERDIAIGYSQRARAEKMKDSLPRNFERVFMSEHFPTPPDPEEGDVTVQRDERSESRNNAVFRFLYDVDSLSVKDSVTVREVDSAYAARLKDEQINVQFRVNRVDSTTGIPPNAVTIGFTKPTSFTLSLQNTLSYMFGKLKLPVLFSLLLVGITIASFVLLYRNMMKQRRLGELKNEFISNITHELKTPIATVGVAIEALKSFNAIHDPKRTAEYLDISQNELQRLNLLVDKVLKLSMFEKKEVELKYELINLKDVVDEVMSSMRLQVEKYRANVSLNVEGDCTLQADRLHLLSVVFNLLDNALKYGSENPVIRINLEEKENNIVLQVSDNGIGIPATYKDKIFDKFFRIPHGDTHNAKGYGLGLSYVAHVVKKHKGSIAVESETGKGTTFIITLPKQNT